MHKVPAGAGGKRAQSRSRARNDDHCIDGIRAGGYRGADITRMKDNDLSGRPADHFGDHHFGLRGVDVEFIAYDAAAGTADNQVNLSHFNAIFELHQKPLRVNCAARSADAYGYCFHLRYCSQSPVTCHLSLVTGHLLLVICRSISGLLAAVSPSGRGSDDVSNGQ